MKKVFFAIMTLSAVLLTSCGSESGSGNENVNIDLVNKLNKSYDYDGKTITIEGNISLAGIVTRIQEGGKVNVIVAATGKKGEKENLHGISINYGEGKNSMFINVPESETNFTDKDVFFYDKDGKKFGTGGNVKLTGLVTYTSKGPRKPLTGVAARLDSIKRKHAPKDDDGNDYSFTITNVVFEKKQDASSN